MEREIASTIILLTIIQLTIGPSKNFLSHIETPYVSSFHGICHIGTSSYLAQSSYLVRNRDPEVRLLIECKLLCPGTRQKDFQLKKRLGHCFSSTKMVSE